MTQNNQEQLSSLLSQFSNEDFRMYIAKRVLGLSEEEVLTVEFVFWFCHAIEQQLRSVLAEAWENMEGELGVAPPELHAFLKQEYGFKTEKVAPSHPDYDARNVTFGDLIHYVELLRGKTPHVNFLWKVKNIRDDLSHGRIQELEYENHSLFAKETKIKLIKDNLRLIMNIKEEKEGGFIGKINKISHDGRETEDKHD